MATACSTHVAIVANRRALVIDAGRDLRFVKASDPTNIPDEQQLRSHQTFLDGPTCWTESR